MRATSINIRSTPSSTRLGRQPPGPVRLGRARLSVHAVTTWQLEPKQTENRRGVKFDLTEAIADKSIAKVKSGGAGDFDLKGLEDIGLDLEFRSEGKGHAAGAPADLFIKDVGSQVVVSIDGQPLEKFKEYKLAVGQEFKVGDDAVFQILRDTRAHA